MEQETMKCPYCGEEILTIAKKCKHCGEWLDEKKPLYETDEKDNEYLDENDSTPHSGSRISSRIGKALFALLLLFSFLSLAVGMSFGVRN